MSYRIVIATHNDGQLSYLEEEANTIKGVLNDPSAGLEINIIPGVKLDYIFKYFEDHREDEDIGFHFAEHVGGLGLLIKDENGNDRTIKGQNLAEFLSLQTSLKFVFLNACATEEEANAIAASGIPFVIATSKAIEDRAASLFAKGFYESLKSSRSIPEAFRAAAAKTKAVVEGSLVKQQYRDLDEPTPQAFAPQDPWKLLMPQPPFDWTFPLKLADNRLRRDRLQQLLVFCNREPQTTLFNEIWNAPAPFPQICIIPGTRNSRHRSFAKRIESHLLEKRAVRNLIPKQLGRWTNCWSNPVNQLKRLTFEPFQFVQSRDLETGKSIVEQFPEGSVIVVHLDIDLDQWHENAEQAILWYIAGFWHFNIQRHNQRVFVFLHLVTNSSKQNLGVLRSLIGLDPASRFLKRLQLLQKQNQWEHLFVFPSLDKISLGHLLRFIDDFEELQINSQMLRQHFRASSEMAKVWEMRQVEDMLKNLIN